MQRWSRLWRWTSRCLIALVGVNALCAHAAPGRARGLDWKYHTHKERIEVRNDGSNVRHYEYAYTALAESALDSLNERTISYHDEGETLTQVVAYTLKKDGRRIDVPDSNVQVTSHAGINGEAPAFSDFKDRRIIFPELEVGDSAVLSYTIEQHKPTFKNRYSLLTYYSEDEAYDDAELVVVAPRGFGLKQKTYHLDAPKQERLDHDREQWTWHYRNPQPPERHDSDAVPRAWHYADLPTIEISNFTDYAQIAAACEAEAAPRAAADERVRKLATQVVGDVGTPRAQAEKLYAWVAKNISFAGNCLNGGDVVPRDTDKVLSLRMGDCKDHATLLQAMLAARGIKSTQVLVDSGRWYELPEIPCWQAFNHVIDYVPDLGLYLDATSTSSPFGVLPEQERGKPVIFTSAYRHIEQTPLRRPDENASSSVDEMTVSADGSIDVHSHFRFAGAIANSLSEWFGKWKKSPDFDSGAQYFRRWIEQLGYKGSGGYDDISDADGPTETFALSMHYHIAGYLDTSNPYGLTLTAPFPGPNAIAKLASFASVDSYDHDFLCHGDTKSEELAITFPDNVKLLAVPKDAHAQTALVRFDASFVQDGNTIRVRRTVADTTPGPICKPEIATQYSKIAAAVKKDARTQAVYAPK